MPLMRFPLSKFAVSLSLVGVAALVGCGVPASQTATSTTANTAEPGAVVHLEGNVHGGAYPIQNALVTLMATTSNGYGGAATNLGSTTSNSGGYFTFGSVATCPSGQYAYIVVTGGHTATATNNNVIQVGVIGTCDQLTANLATTEVFLSELSTVAAAYALGNFITIDSTTMGQQVVNISAPVANSGSTGVCYGPGNPAPSGQTTPATMTCTAAGLAHGFANAYNMVDSVRFDNVLPTGQARATVPGNASGIVPQALINTLGNILQSCVDSGGGTAGDGTSCGTLFTDARPTVGPVPKTPQKQQSFGPAPTNTLQVALNMARQPTNNVGTMYNLQPSATFFTPDLIAAPPNFALSIVYTGMVSGGQTMVFQNPVDVALDANDSAYVLQSISTTEASVASLTSNGSAHFSGSFFAAPNPSAIALDYASVPNAWVTDDSANTVTTTTANCTAGLDGCLWELSGDTGAQEKVLISIPAGMASGVAVDRANSVWVSRDSNTGQSLYRFDATSGYASTSFSTAPNLKANSKRILVDADQDVWGVTTNGTATAFEFDYGYSLTQNAALQMNTYKLNTSGGFGVAVTQGLTAYFPLNGETDTASVLGCTNCGSYSYVTNGQYAQPSSTTPDGVALDGNGSLFWTDPTLSDVIELIPGPNGNLSNSNAVVEVAFSPCYLPVGATTCTSVSKLRSMAIDSSGALWYVANTGGLVIQTFGVAANAWPLIAYANAGVALQ